MVLRVIIPPKIDRSNKIGNPLVGNFSLRTPKFLVVQNTKQINKQKFELNFTGHKYQEDRIFDAKYQCRRFLRCFAPTEFVIIKFRQN